MIARIEALPRWIWLVAALGMIGVWWSFAREQPAPKPVLVEATPRALTGTPVPVPQTNIRADQARQIGLLAQWTVGKTAESSRKTAVQIVAVAPDSTTIATGGLFGAIVLWNRENGTKRVLSNGDTREITALAFAPDGKLLASGAQDNTVRVWNVADGKLLHTFESLGWKLGLAWSPDGSMIAATSTDGTITILNAASGQVIRTLAGHTEFVTGVDWSADGTTLITTSWDDTVRLWRVADGAPLRVIEANMVSGTDVAWSPDGSMFAASSRDSSVRVWRADGTLLHRFLVTDDKEDRTFVQALGWSPDGTLIAALDRDAMITVFRAADGLPLVRLSAPPQNGGEVGADFANLAWSPDGTMIVARGATGALQLWGLP